MLFEKSNASLLDDYNKRVYGHETAKKALITLVSRSRMRHYQKYHLDVPDSELMEPSKLLLIGDSGTGKTFLVEQLAHMLDFPLLCVDATQLTPSGNSDGINQKKFRAECTKTVNNWVESRKARGFTVSQAGAQDQLVIYIDEIDKLAHSFDSSGNWNRHVQSNFLTMFDNHGEGAGVSFIFSGAFSGMKPKVKHTLGFGAETVADVPMLDDELVQYGLIPEFVGRLTSIVKLDTFVEADYRHILYDTLLPAKQHGLSFFNDAHLDIPDSEISNLVQRALKSSQGVRYLKRQLDALALDAEFNYEENSHEISPTDEHTAI